MADQPASNAFFREKRVFGQESVSGRFIQKDILAKYGDWMCDPLF